MHTFLRHASTGQYFESLDRWTPDRDSAHDFGLVEAYGIGGTLGREMRGEVVLVSHLRAALERLNPALPPESIAADLRSP